MGSWRRRARPRYADSANPYDRGVPVPKHGLGEVLIKVFANGVRHNVGHDLPSCFTGQGFASQISAAGWAIVRSLENLPEPTMRIARD